MSLRESEGGHMDLLFDYFENDNYQSLATFIDILEEDEAANGEYDNREEYDNEDRFFF